ncbi:hypothetical protein EC80569_2130, partial [Escherichia coli 8.0569]
WFQRSEIICRRPCFAWPPYPS